MDWKIIYLKVHEKITNNANEKHLLLRLYIYM